MRRAIVIEIECDANIYSLKDIEAGAASALVQYFGDDVNVLNVEVADGTPKEAFGVGLEK